MQQSPFNLHQPGLVLLIGLAGSTLPRHMPRQVQVWM